MAPAVATYAPRDPSGTVLYHVIAEHLETLLASFHDDPEATGFPAYVQREFYDYLRCGILAHGFLRLGCDACKHECWCPSVASDAGFAHRVPDDAWPRWRHISSSRSSPGSPRGNGWCRYRSPCATGWRPRSTSRLRSIPSFAPRSVSITSTRRSHKVTSGLTSTRDRLPLSNVLAAP